MATKESTLSLDLSRRQKRLAYWYEHFANSYLATNEELGDLLETFALVVGKVAAAKTQEERDESWIRMIDVERKIERTFAQSQLRTSQIT